MNTHGGLFLEDFPSASIVIFDSFIHEVTKEPSEIFTFPNGSVVKKRYPKIFGPVRSLRSKACHSVVGQVE
jgi:hypothetical protein